MKKVQPSVSIYVHLHIVLYLMLFIVNCWENVKVTLVNRHFHHCTLTLRTSKKKKTLNIIRFLRNRWLSHNKVGSLGWCAFVNGFFRSSFCSCKLFDYVHVTPLSSEFISSRTFTGAEDKCLIEINTKISQYSWSIVMLTKFFDKFLLMKEILNCFSSLFVSFVNMLCFRPWNAVIKILLTDVIVIFADHEIDPN